MPQKGPKPHKQLPRSKLIHKKRMEHKDFATSIPKQYLLSFFVFSAFFVDNVFVTKYVNVKCEQLLD